LNADLKAYEVLGVKPGVSIQELKAAHRDLAKVWHPDRFGHDPRLQAKAQEKLKEINEAYDGLISAKTPRSAPQPPREQRAYTAPARRAIGWQWIAVLLLVFAAVFAVTSRGLLQKHDPPSVEQEQPATQSAKPDQGRATRPDANTRADVSDSPRKANPEQPAPEVAASESVPAQPTPALATVTVTIDPESGLLAKPDCPLRSRMTYPSGSQPSGYCNISHAPPPKKKLDRISKIFQD